VQAGDTVLQDSLYISKLGNYGPWEKFLQEQSCGDRKVFELLMRGSAGANQLDCPSINAMATCRHMTCWNRSRGGPRR